MQPNQQPPEEWQPPTPSTTAAPYQVPAEPVVEPNFTPAQQVTVSSPVVPQQPPVQTEPLGDAPAPTSPVAPQVGAPEATIADEQLTTDLPEGDATPSGDDDTVLLRWEGSEYIHHNRGALWYVIFAAAAIVAGVLAILVLKSITFAILIPVMAAALLVYVRRAPELLQYTLSRKGLHVNDKLYTYDQFKSFGVTTHDGVHSAILAPRKRFQIGQTIYFPEEVGEPLVDMLAQRLPMTDVAPDAIDRLLAKLHL